MKVGFFTSSVFLSWLSLSIVNCDFSTNYTAIRNLTTDEDSIGSKVHFSHESCQTETLSGFEFRHFYSVNPFFNDNGILEITVKFKGVSDGHIALTETSTINSTDALYLIIFGSYSNKVCEIRRSKWGHEVFKMNTPEILSDKQFRGFLIRYNKSKGEIVIYSEGSEMPLLHWIDPNPLQIKYFSFSAYDNVIVQVAFNCKLSEEHIIMTPINPGLKNRLFMIFKRT